MSRSTTRALAVVRHPGPVHMLAEVVRALPELSWTVAAQGAALNAARRDPVLAAALTPRPPDEAATARDPVSVCRKLVEDARPDLVVRTTPSTGEGLDEVVADVVRARVPVVCLQDFPGVGADISATDLVLTVDAEAGRWVTARYGARTAAVGWVAHERFALIPPRTEVRAAFHRVAGLNGRPLALLVGASSDVPVDDEAEWIRRVTASLRAAEPLCDVWVTYRVHPRRAPVERERLTAMGPSPVGPADGLVAAADLVLSRASVMNLEALAHAGADVLAGRADPAVMPISLYVDRPDGPLFPGYWGPEPPRTHRPGGGSLVIGTADVTAAVGAVWADREPLGQEALIYAPRGSAVHEAVRVAVSGVLPEVRAPRPVQHRSTCEAGG